MYNELRSFILADSAVATLIGTRMYPNTLPQNPAFPAVTYQPVSAVRTSTLRHADNLPMVRVQIDAWSKNVGQAREVANAIRALFHYYNWGIAGVQRVKADDQREDYEPDTLLHRVSTDYLVHYAEN